METPDEKGNSGNTPVTRSQLAFVLALCFALWCFVTLRDEGRISRLEDRTRALEEQNKARAQEYAEVLAGIKGLKKQFEGLGKDFDRLHNDIEIVKKADP